MRKSFIYLIALIISTGCSTSTNPTTDKMDKPFFDITAFLEKEIDGNQLTEIEKTVRINGESETKVLKDFDLKKELSIFFDSDINKPSLFDKYNTFETDHSITYKTEEKELPVQRIKVFKAENGDIQKLLINLKADKQIYTSDKELTYEPKVGFSIRSTQKVPLSDEKAYEIEVKF